MPANVELRDRGLSIDLRIGSNILTLHRGDLTSLKADAIVCPVNQSLDTKTGLAKVIMKAAGRAPHYQRPVFAEPFGRVVVLPGGRLEAQYIFLTVLLGEKGLDKVRHSIGQAVERAIRYAEFLRLKSIAFPVLGSPEVTPPYSFVAKEMIDQVSFYFRRRKTKLKAILFSIFNAEAYEAFRREARQAATL